MGGAIRINRKVRRWAGLDLQRYQGKPHGNSRNSIQEQPRKHIMALMRTSSYSLHPGPLLKTSDPEAGTSDSDVRPSEVSRPSLGFPGGRQAAGVIIRSLRAHSSIKGEHPP